MKIVIPGGTGQVGAVLKRALAGAGHEVVILTRRPKHQGEVQWDGQNLGPWTAAVDGSDVVINLAGRTVSCRYTAANLQEMMDSRVDSARVVGAAIAGAAQPPRVRWRRRSGARTPSRCSSAAMSWIHEHDFVRAVEFLIDRGDIAGPVNLAAPHPLPQRAFMRTLRSVWGVPVGLPATKWMAGVGAFALRTDTELLLKSRRVVPGRLDQAGFDFQYTQWPQAADELVHRVRKRVGRGPAARR
ncbi:DUF1731 domain-containing protein [Streptomyces tendae]